MQLSGWEKWASIQALIWGQNLLLEGFIKEPLSFLEGYDSRLRWQLGSREIQDNKIFKDSSYKI